MYKAVIIDDEKNSCEFIEGLITKYFSKDVLVLKTFINSIEALEYLNTKAVDLVFLDVQMPNLNGIELLRLTAKKGFATIFTTAHSEYSIQGIKLNAFDYLLKPIGVDEFIESVNRYLNSSKKVAVDPITTAKNLSLAVNTDLNRKLTINHQTGIDVVHLYDILYAVAEENYCNVVLYNGIHVRISKPLKFIEEQIDSKHFFRSHKSFLVNLFYVYKYNKITSHLELTNGVSISVSERKKDQLLEVLS